MSARKAQKEKMVKQKFSLQLMWKQRYLLLMSVPFVVWLIVFKYIPLWGWTMAFQDVKPKTMTLPVWERPFVGFDNFIKAFQDRIFGQTLINTIGLSVLGIALGTVMAILFALMLNEICFVRFKKITQTISYLPHFVSWVVIASIAKMVLNDGGMLDTALHTRLGLMSTNSPIFWVTVCLINIWKEVGWDAIVYLSAMAGIDQGLYEAAKVDGANRIQRIWHITLPGIKPTIVVLLIMGIGGALNVGMERQMLLSNGIVQDHAM
ncbi:MAG: ABC transporter permease subunit, partial [Lachnospiraceae bacterium]|nr:ABC transporter permease subunit [Lachnospiraceae bacterium]